MQEEQQEQGNSQSNDVSVPVQPSPVSRPKVDFYLQELVNMANERGVEMGITLVLGGSVITGTLIGGATYFESFAENFASNWNGDEESKQTMREALAQPARLYGVGRSEPIGPTFIHLKDARIFTPSGSMPTQGMLWRGRLTEVSGFSLGSWTQG